MQWAYVGFFDGLIATLWNLDLFFIFWKWGCKGCLHFSDELLHNEYIDCYGKIWYTELKCLSHPEWEKLYTMLHTMRSDSRSFWEHLQPLYSLQLQRKVQSELKCYLKSAQFLKSCITLEQLLGSSFLVLFNKENISAWAQNIDPINPDDVITISWGFFLSLAHFYISDR